MSATLDVALTWPRGRLGGALGALDRVLREREDERQVPDPAPDLASGPALERWLEAGARRLGLEVGPIDERARGLHDLLPAGTRAVLVARLPEEDATGSDRYLVLVGPVSEDARTVRVLAPSGTHDVPVAVIEDRLFRGAVSPAAAAAMSLPPRRKIAASRALRAAIGGGLRAPAWIVEDAPSRFVDRARRVGALRALGVGLAGFVGQVLLFTLAWAVVGKGALEGRLEAGTLAAFGLLLATMVVLRAHAASAIGRAIVLLAGLVRERLLEGILRLDAGEIRSRGVGQLLGTVLEADSLELLARAGGPAVMWALLDVALGAWLLGVGAVGLIELPLLLLWLVLLGLSLRGLYGKLVSWTDARLEVTHDLVEAMVGHRTFVAQDAGARHVQALRASLEHYEERSERLDATTARLVSFVPRGFVVLALLGLCPAFLDRGTSPGAIATTLGGVLLVWGALRRLTDAGPAVTAAVVAYRNLRFLFAAAARAERVGADVAAAGPDEAAVGRRGLLVGRDVMFRYEGRPEAVLKGCSFAVRRGERVLLEGGSGGGKSTFGSLVAGLRQPSSGVLLLGGFDHHSVGPERWRQRASGVPQFHENHVFAGPLLFNLLLGRRWPPRQEDVDAATAVCEELGLGPLLARMPAGLNQTVGDSGWQLSHGEKSRVFVARSLLQKVDLRVFDESLAALDPETSVRVLEALLRRPEALVLIAHR